MSIRQPFGLFALKPGEKNRNISEAQLRLPKVAGLTIRFRPADIASNWTYLDSQVNLARKTGDKYTLLCMSGAAAQPWTDANVQQFVRIINACGDRYQDCDGWHVTGCTPRGISEELHWSNPMSVGVLNANKKLTAASAKAFPGCVLLQAISAKDRSGRMQDLIDYGVKVAPGRYLVKHNALKCIEIDARHNQLVVDAAKNKGTLMGFEMVGGTRETLNGKPRTGSRDIMDSVNQAYELARRANYPPENLYIAIYMPDLSELR